MKKARHTLKIKERMVEYGERKIKVRYIKVKGRRELKKGGT